jgi:hypothetical protein
MAQNYTRQSSFADGDTITASLFNNEFNQVVNAFSYSASSDSSTGHKHDGTAGQGGNIPKIGDIDFLNKIVVDSTNNRWGIFVEVAGGPVEQVRIQDGGIVPVTTNDIDLGTASLQFKDIFIDGTANIDSLVLSSGSTVTTILDEDDLVSDSATALATQQSIKAYVDAQVTAQDLDIVGDTGTDAIDLDSETLTFTGGTGITSVVTAGTVTHNIDSTVATLTGTQTLTNKSLTAPTLTGTAIVASLDISGDIDVDGTTNLDVVDIDGAVDMASTLAVGSTIAIGQTSFSGGSILLDLHGSGSGTGSQASFYNDHNTSGFQIGLAGNTSGDVIFYNVANTDMDFYTNNLLRFSIAADGSLSTPTLGTSNVRFGVNAGNSIIAGGNYNVVVGDEAGTSITTGDENVAVGYQAGDALTTGIRNIAIGKTALGAATTSDYNTAIGYEAMGLNTTGTRNTALGVQALYSNVDGDNSVAIGYEALFNQDPASNVDMYNVAVGYAAGKAVTTGTNNTLIGGLAGDAITTADNNTAVGQAALGSNTTAANNTAVGYAALTANTTGTQNVAVGSQSLLAHTTGNSNVAVGQNALVSNTTASDNTSVGAFSLDANTTGANNTAVGKEALGSNTTADNNTAVGHQAGYNKTGTGDDNVFIGRQAGYFVTTGSGNTYVGGASGPNSSAATTGSDNTAVGSGAGSTITTGAKNTILGRYNGNQGGLDIRTASNHIVLSDGDGNPRAYWDAAGAATFGGAVDSKGQMIIRRTISNNEQLRLASEDGIVSITAYNGVNTDRVAIHFVQDTTGTDYTPMVIDASGNLGISESSPVAKIHIQGSGTSGQVTSSLILENSSSGTAGLQITGAAGSSHLDFMYGGGPSTGTNTLTTGMSMTLEGSGAGFVGIGTNSPLSKLNAKGTQGNWRVDPDSVSGEIQVFSTTTANDGFRDFRIRTQQTIFDTAGAERMRIDSLGNVGIGVVPSTDHNPVVEALQIGSTANLFGRNDAEVTTLTSNSYLSVAGYPKYITTNEASEYTQISGNHIWYNAPSGTAGAACTQTERMRIDASGNVKQNSVNTSTNAGYAVNNGTYDAIALGTGGFGVNGGAATDGGIRAYNNLLFGTGASSTERMRIDAGGSVLIGKTTPADLHASWNHIIIGEKGAIISTKGGVGLNGITLADNAYVDSDTGNYAYQTAGAASQITQTGGAITFSNAASGSAGAALTPVPRMTLDASGNLLVGNTTSFSSVVRGQFAGASNGIYISSTAAAGTGDNLIAGFHTGSTIAQGTLSFAVATNGNVINTNNSYGAISDIKLKENITDATPKLAGINQVRVVNYNLISSPDVKQLGVVAQELEQIFPGMVDETPDRDEDGNDLGTVTKSVKYSVFVPMLIKAMQEQQAIIEALTARIEALEGAN